MSFTDPIVTLQTIAMGIGATIATDLWAAARKRLLGVPALDYALVGRWIAHMPHGRFAHAPIGAAAPKAFEAVLGWAVHFLTGIAFAAGLVLWQGSAWLATPSLLPALLFGTATVVFPFFVMQPALGAGWAASRAPRPWLARMHSLVMHAVFGLGLYACALLIR
ncbi:DUF2938 domain-containing protein [Comamonas sp. GB3 AK4-5]|uniref:DUF2938 domain-containing protein n=1 Tax=Comamonas sp. GB3 AK4-5 TaxID=3231487 RepID=UPI00351EB7AC